MHFLRSLLYRFDPQSFRIQRDQSSEFWEHINSKTAVVEDVVREVPVAVGTARAPRIVEGRTAPQHTVNIIRCSLVSLDP